MTDLQTLVEPLKRELAVPGVFEDFFPNTDDDSLAASLADGFAEAQLRGFFTDLTLDASAAPAYQTSADLSAGGGALIVLMTAMRIIRADLRSMTLNSRYKAGPVEVETSKSAMILRDELQYMRARVDDLITQARKSGRTVYVTDGYVGRVLANTALGAFYGYEYRG